MSSTAEDLVRRHRYTAEDYYRMGEVGILAPDARVELIDGEVIEMTPIGAPHASIVTDLQNRLVPLAGHQAVVRIQNPIHLGRHDEPKPDLALVTPPASKYRTRHPEPPDILLLIEVAETSLRVDRDLKLGIYARFAVPEVWLVDINGRRITRYRDPSETGFRASDVLDLAAPVPIPGLPSLRLDLSALL
ncbi:MAG: Uma2 family endonuclease [Chromatiaceae bacterium]|jgi:Uma2 family endonuclease